MAQMYTNSVKGRFPLKSRKRPKSAKDLALVWHLHRPCAGIWYGSVVNYQYDVAEICERGHIINENVGRNPNESKPNCRHCGAKGITECPSCHKPIRGRIIYDSHSLTTEPHMRRPDYCAECGKPYPWTFAGIEIAQEMIEELSALDDEDRQVLREALPSLIQRTGNMKQRKPHLLRKASPPSTQAGATKRNTGFLLSSERRALLESTTLRRYCGTSFPMWFSALIARQPCSMSSE